LPQTPPSRIIPSMVGPLQNPKHDSFAIAVAAGHNLTEANALAGFKGRGAKERWLLRNQPEVNARIRDLLRIRAETETPLFVRRQKSEGNLRERALEELEAIAFADIGEVIDWRREFRMNADGEFVDIAESIQMKESRKLTAAARKSIKGVFLKSGHLRVEFHDKRQALVELIKLVSRSDVPTTNNVTLNQLIPRLDDRNRSSPHVKARSAKRARACARNKRDESRSLRYGIRAHSV
jgi:hypothetical protein